MQFGSKYQANHGCLLFANHRLYSEINDDHGSWFYRWELIFSYTYTAKIIQQIK